MWLTCSTKEVIINDKPYVNRILNIDKLSQIGKRTIEKEKTIEAIRFTMDSRSTAEWWFNTEEERDETYNKIVELVELKVV